MPDEDHGSSHVSLRVPNEVIAAFDRLAAALERSRSWVMLQALRFYLEEEGAEIFEDLESLAELDRGESAPLEESLRSVKEILHKADQKRVPDKP